MNSSKSKKILVYVIMGLLSLLSLYSEITICFKYKTFQWIAELVALCIMIALIFYYAISNFKVSHGNLLKYLFIAFSVMTFFGIIMGDPKDAVASENVFLCQTLRGIVVIVSAYIAGRLDRIKENSYLIIICALILLGTSIYNAVVYNLTSFVQIIFICNFFILWVDLMIAYILRYKEHKEAGLADK